MGKPQKRSPELANMAKKIYEETGSGNETARKLGISSPTLYRMLADIGVHVPNRTDPKPNRRILDDADAKLLVVDYQNGDSLRSMKKKYNVSDWAIREVMRRNNLPIRPSGGCFRKVDATQYLEIVRLYTEEKLSQQQIAVKYKCNQGVISRVLTECGINCGFGRGKDSSGWQGGLTRTEGGYIREFVEIFDPFAVMRDRSGYVLQHRLVMAKNLNRPLNRDEIVHHKNGIRDDNRIENLQIVHKHHGAGASYRCACCGSENVVPSDLYDEAISFMNKHKKTIEDIEKNKSEVTIVEISASLYGHGGFTHPNSIQDQYITKGA